MRNTEPLYLKLWCNVNKGTEINKYADSTVSISVPKNGWPVCPQGHKEVRWGEGRPSVHSRTALRCFSGSLRSTRIRKSMGSVKKCLEFQVQIVVMSEQEGLRESSASPQHTSRSLRTGSWWEGWFPWSFHCADQTCSPQGWWEFWWTTSMQGYSQQINRF